MKIKSITNIFPTFVMVGQAEEFSRAENEELSKLSWEVYRNNFPTETLQARVANTGYYTSEKRHDLFEDYCHLPVVMKLAEAADSMCRAYMREIYHFDCIYPIKMMAEPFCQNEETGKNGMACHTHVGKPLFITYYPSVKLKRRAHSSIKDNGINGEVSFYDPANVGRRIWPCLNTSFASGSTFRVAVREGMFTAFEGHVPHDSAPFEGEERVCIPIICYPKLPSKNLGSTLEALRKKVAENENK